MKRRESGKRGKAAYEVPYLHRIHEFEDWEKNTRAEKKDQLESSSFPPNRRFENNRRLTSRE